MKETAQDTAGRLGGTVISDRVVTQLLEQLRSGRYAGLDRLPAELDLAAELGVSRTVVRDALSTLERSGYVERNTTPSSAPSGAAPTPTASGWR